MRRVRHALDAFRLMEGRWPGDLAELERSGLVDGAALASTSARPYYYVQRDGKALLLAPER